MNTTIINAINKDGKRTQFKITESCEYHRLYWDDNELYHQAGKDLNEIIDYVRYIMNGDGFHADDIVTMENGASHSRTFDLTAEGDMIVKFYEWIGGRYVQLGPEEHCTVNFAKTEYGWI